MIVHGITPILNVSEHPRESGMVRGLGWRRCWMYNDSGMIEGGATRTRRARRTSLPVGSGAVEIFLCREGQGSRTDAAGTGRRSRRGVWLSWWRVRPRKSKRRTPGGGTKLRHQLAADR